MTPAERLQGTQRAFAEGTLDRHVLDFIAAGSDSMVTTAAAESAWRSLRFAPHCLRDVTNVNPGVELLGERFASPVGIAPFSMQRLIHDGGEVELGKGAAGADALVVVSTNAGRTFVEVAETGARWWLQVYLPTRRELIAPTITAALEAGAAALVLTVDTPHPGPKPTVDRSALGDLAGVYGVNHPELVRGVTPGFEHSWSIGPHDVSWLTEFGAPVVVKGVTRGDDARRALHAGAAGVWVSNHGGRQLDRTRPTAEALPEVVAALGAEAEVYVDGGVRSGLDVLAATALGARAVFLGRPFAWALAGGAEAVSALHRDLVSDLETRMRLAGCADLAAARGIVVD